MMARVTILDLVYREYKNQVNMTALELLKWSKNPLSRKASLSRNPIRRNLTLLSKPKYKWTVKDAKSAITTIGYLKRAKKIKSKNYIARSGYTKNQIAMKNWGFDIRKR